MAHAFRNAKRAGCRVNLLRMAPRSGNLVPSRRSLDMSSRSPMRVWHVVAVTVLLATSAQAQQPRGASPLDVADKTGFTSIFDGTMNGWDGDPAFWRAENGALIGESSPQNVVKENTFLVWRGGRPGNFELKVQFRINSTNSGIQFRSVQLAPGTQQGNQPVEGRWVLKGYQADIDFNNQWTGQIYEERGRGFLAMRGQAVYVPDGGGPRTIGNLQRSPDELKALVKINDWNQIHIIARGNTLIQMLNGSVSSIVVDDDSKNRATEGLLGFQMHVGLPMKVEYRNIWLKELPKESAAIETALEEQLAAYRRTVRDWGSLTRYGSDNTEVSAPAPSEERVVFIGDEIVERWNDKTFFSGKPYLNRGITGPNDGADARALQARRHFSEATGGRHSGWKQRHCGRRRSRHRGHRF